MKPMTLPAPKVEAPAPDRTATLTPDDRCDSCETAQARVRVTISTGQELDFCKHHYEKHIDALAKYDVVDERWTLEGGK